MTPSASLANRSTVRELVAAFVAAERAVRSAFAQIHEAEVSVNAVFMGAEDRRGLHVDASHGHGQSDFRDADDAIERLSRQAWVAIVARLELQRMMSIARYADLQKDLDKGTLPAITEENVIAFVQGYCASIPEMIAEAVQEVFNWLRPERSQYKTNTELEIGRRVILSWMVDTGYGANPFRINYRKTQHLMALENVFHALDGKGMVSKTGRSALQMAIEASPTGKGNTDLFRFAAHKNGNLHLEILRPDLLEKFNMMAGGMNLRPASAAA